MLLLQAIQLKKSFGDRLLISIPEFSVYSGDRIGIVGANGSGKSTLLDILAGKQESDSGTLKCLCDISYCEQLNREEPALPSTAITEEAAGQSAFTTAAAWNHLTNRNPDILSGGEETRRKLSEALKRNAPLVFLDEPTANLDMESTALLTKDIRRLSTFLLISHDRDLLNTVCTAIAELKNGTLTVYEGNYSKYEELKELETKRSQEEYEAYEEEKARLSRVYDQKMQAARNAAKIPRGMSPREARLRNFLCSSRSFDGREKRANQAAKAVQKRIDQMDVKEKPRTERSMYLDFSLTDPPENKVVIEAQHITCGYPGTPLLTDAAFVLPNHKKAALLGPNGSGKTTLLNLLFGFWLREQNGNGRENGRFEAAPGLAVDPETRFRFVPRVKPAYFYQRFDNIDRSLTVLENALADTVQKPQAVRSILAKLLFQAQDLNKQASVLSGGELIKLSLAKLFVSPCNLLLLDEPTNYLDMPSVVALQNMIQEYEGTILYVSHDKRFIKETADYLIRLENRTIRTFDGTAEQFEEAGKSRKSAGKKKSAGSRSSGSESAEKMLLELSLARVVNQLGSGQCDKDTLEQEYQRITEELKRYR